MTSPAPRNGATQDANDCRRNGTFDPNATVPIDSDGSASHRVVEPLRTLAELGADWLDVEPPPRQYLLSAHVGDKLVGVLASGIVGMLAAAGAAGKSWLAILLALCVATGRDWFGLRVRPGRVLLAMGEEGPDEVQRRLYFGADRLGLDRSEKQVAYERIYALPLAGHATALTTLPGNGVLRGGAPDPADGLPVTEAYWTLLERIELTGRANGWRLILLDPLSRFAGPDAEKDSSLATSFVQALERFSAVVGNPSVWINHHTNQTARQGAITGKTDAARATASRGVTGLSDAVRWQAELHALERLKDAPELVRFAVTKSNYAQYPEDIYLARDHERHGALRLATPEEMARYGDTRAAQDTAQDDEQDARDRSATEAAVLEVLRVHGELSTRELRAHVLGREGDTDAAAERLRVVGRIIRNGTTTGGHRRWTLCAGVAGVAASGPSVAGPQGGVCVAGPPVRGRATPPVPTSGADVSDRATPPSPGEVAP